MCCAWAFNSSTNNCQGNEVEPTTAKHIWFSCHLTGLLAATEEFSQCTTQYSQIHTLFRVFIRKWTYLGMLLFNGPETFTRFLLWQVCFVVYDLQRIHRSPFLQSVKLKFDSHDATPDYCGITTSWTNPLTCEWHAAVQSLHCLPNRQVRQVVWSGALPYTDIWGFPGKSCESTAVDVLIKSDMSVVWVQDITLGVATSTGQLTSAAAKLQSIDFSFPNNSGGNGTLGQQCCRNRDVNTAGGCPLACSTVQCMS